MIIFANSLGDLGSIPGHVIPKTLKMVLDTWHVSKVNWNNPGKGVAPFPAPQLLKMEPSGRPRLRSPTLLITYWHNPCVNSDLDNTVNLCCIFAEG